MIREREQAEEQQRCLHECRQTDSRHLLAPLIEAIGVSAGDAEHIRASNCHLNEQDAAAPKLNQSASGILCENDAFKAEASSEEV